MKVNLKNIGIFSAALVLLVSIVFIVSYYVVNSKVNNPVKVTLTSGNELKHTEITPQMEAKIEKGKSLVYCSTFQLAWNELKDNIIKSDIVLKGSEQEAALMNKSLSTGKDISEKDYVAMVGYNKDNILGKINKSLKDKFGMKAPVVTEKLDYPNDILAYAYLNKELQFTDKFDSIKNPIIFNNESVDSFGIEKFTDNEHSEEIGKQVEILAYKDDSDFIINLKPKDSKEEIILAKLQPKETLLETINDVDNRIKSGKKESLSTGDTLQIPIIHCNVQKNFSQFENKYVENKGFEQYVVSKAVQTIQFKLDRNGAEIASDARIVLKETAATAKIIKEKHLIFNKPFLLMLKEKGSAYPYFAIWVDNAEMLGTK